MDYTELREDVKDELTQLRARVRELEQKESNLFIISNDMIKRRDARIRELEEAMSEVNEKLLEPGWPEDKDLPGIADIIEAVMRKEWNE